jgi:cation:H+ antiporter
MVWLKFACCAAVILLAGSKLSLNAEQIAEKSGLSKGFAGLVLLAVVSSLSQLVTCLSALVVHDLHDMAVSALMGSCMFNMMLIGLLDLFSKERPVSHMVHDSHILSAGFGIILIGLASVDILYGKHLPTITIFHSMDPITLAFVPLYLIAMRLICVFERSKKRESEPTEAHAGNQSWLKLISIFMVCTACIIAASYYLPALAEGIADLTGWGQGFIGTTFIAIATCLPELSVSFSSAKRGAFDMAVASLLGANLCYMVVLAISDFCYLKEPLLRHVSETDALAALCAMISMGIVVIALTYRSEKKFLFIAGDAVALILIYVFGATLLFISH